MSCCLEWPLLMPFSVSTTKQLEYGIESEGRNRIISDFVAANYELHQREIFSAIVTEYTDWQVVMLLSKILS